MPSLLGSEEHTSELQSLRHLVCRLLLEKKKQILEKLTTSPHTLLYPHLVPRLAAQPAREHIGIAHCRESQCLSHYRSLVFFFFKTGAPPGFPPFPPPPPSPY